MKLFHLKDIPKTIAHDNLIRQRFVAPGDLQSKVQTVNYVELLPGESYTPHDHSDCEESFFVIEGSAEAVIAGKKQTITKGDFIVVEPKEMHVFTNTSQKIFIYFQFRVLL